MRFLLDADIPRSSALTFRKFGHEVVDVRDLVWEMQPTRK